VILSGGNADPAMLGLALQQWELFSRRYVYINT
jgi:hypothetical protein